MWVHFFRHPVYIYIYELYQVLETCMESRSIIEKILWVKIWHIICNNLLFSYSPIKFISTKSIKFITSNLFVKLYSFSDVIIDVMFYLHCLLVNTIWIQCQWFKAEAINKQRHPNSKFLCRWCSNTDNICIFAQIDLNSCTCTERLSLPDLTRSFACSLHFPVLFRFRPCARMWWEQERLCQFRFSPADSLLWAHLLRRARQTSVEQWYVIKN